MPVRERFPFDPASPVLRLLLHQDGSTTRLLEMLAGGPVSVQVLEQGVVRKLPPQLQGALPGRSFLRRMTALHAHGHVLLDSLSYIALDALPAGIVEGLQRGSTPIGHLLARLWVRRSFRAGDTQLFDELWNVVGVPDPLASRSCTILTPAGPCLVLAETFRRGVLPVEGGAPLPISGAPPPAGCRALAPGAAVSATGAGDFSGNCRP